MVLALENHIDSVAETLDGALWLLDAVPGLRLAYDPSHLAAQEIDPRDAIPLMDAAAHVHLRDAAPGRIQVPFGEGTLDLDWILRTFLERGYTGHVAIEYLGDGEPETLRSVVAARELASKYWPDAP